MEDLKFREYNGCIFYTVIGARKPQICVKPGINCLRKRGLNRQINASDAPAFISPMSDKEKGISIQQEIFLFYN